MLCWGCGNRLSARLLAYVSNGDRMVSFTEGREQVWGSQSRICFGARFGMWLRPLSGHADLELMELLSWYFNPQGKRSRGELGQGPAPWLKSETIWRFGEGQGGRTSLVSVWEERHGGVATQNPRQGLFGRQATNHSIQRC